MKRLIIHVEGQTEETFVREVVAPHLYESGFSTVSARIVGNPRNRGGIVSWAEARAEIVGHLKQDRRWIVSTFVDYYGMPSTGQRAWPGREDSNNAPVQKRASLVEERMRREVLDRLEDADRPDRFVPFVMLHEFEALLFSDCERFASAVARPEKYEDFQEVRDEFGTPEEINDSPETAPSKRVTSILGGYSKPFLGVLGAIGVGLPAMRSECPHFDAWLRTLESMAE